MNRGGTALVATLWLVVALTGVTALGLSVVQRSVWTARNRIWLIRTGWAREACWAIVRARYARPQTTPDAQSPASPADLPRTDLGQGLWCQATWEHPERQLNLNTAPATVLSGLLRNPQRVAALLDWRDPDTLARAAGAEAAWYRERGRQTPRNGPLAAVEELRLIRGFDSATVAALGPLMTTRGSGKLDINTASLALLRLLPGVGDEALSLLERHRSRGQRLNGWNDLLVGLSGPATVAMLAEEGQLQQFIGFEPEVLWLRLTAGIDGTPILSESRLGIVAADRRLAVIQVEAP